VWAEGTTFDTLYSLPMVISMVPQWRCSCACHLLAMEGRWGAAMGGGVDERSRGSSTGAQKHR
jgi:hypothetical protein